MGPKFMLLFCSKPAVETAQQPGEFEAFFGYTQKGFWEKQLRLVSISDRAGLLDIV